MTAPLQKLLRKTLAIMQILLCTVYTEFTITRSSQHRMKSKINQSDLAR